MVQGFIRLKGRASRRPGMPLETRWQYVRRRVGDLWRYVSLWPRLALEMEDVWLRTRTRSSVEQRVIEELKRLPSSWRGWRRLKASEIQTVYRQAVAAMPRGAPRGLPHPHLVIPPTLLLWCQRWNPCAHSLTWSRHSIRRFWRTCQVQVKRGRLLQVDISGLLFNSVQETTLFATFAYQFFSRLLIRLFAQSTAHA